MIKERHLARIAAMQTIFILLQRPQLNLDDVLDYIIIQLPDTLKDISFSSAIVKGSFKNENSIKKVIKKYTKEKSLKKIDPITQSILYIGIFELKFTEDKQPQAVIINEAIELAKEYGKDTSPGLVNAILSKASDDYK